MALLVYATRLRIEPADLNASVRPVLLVPRPHSTNANRYGLCSPFGWHSDCFCCAFPAGELCQITNPTLTDPTMTDSVFIIPRRLVAAHFRQPRGISFSALSPACRQ
jgi:hypothetical protein